MSLHQPIYSSVLVGLLEKLAKNDFWRKMELVNQEFIGALSHYVPRRKGRLGKIFEVESNDGLGPRYARLRRARDDL